MLKLKNLLNFRSKLLKESFFTISEQIFSSFIVFTVGILLARSTSKDDFGFYILAMSIIMIIIGFQRAILLTPYAILFKNKSDALKEKYRTFISLSQFIILCFVTLISLIFIFLIYSFFETNIKIYISFFVFLLSQLIFYYFKYTLIAELRVKTNFFYCSVIYLLTITCCLIIYLGKYLDTYSYFLYIGMLSISISSFFIFFNKINLRGITKSQTKEYLREHIKLGKWIVGSNIAFILSSQIYPWALLFFWNKQSVAELGVILTISRVLAPAIQGMSSYLLPKFTLYVGSPIQLQKLIKKLVALMLFVSIILISFGFLVGESILNLLYSSKYNEIGLLVAFGFAIQAISLINMPIDAGLNAVKRTDLGFKTLLISASVTMFIGIPLTWKAGVEGALLGMLLSLVSGLIFRINYLKKEIKAKF